MERVGRKGLGSNTGGSSASPDASTHRVSQVRLRPFIYVQDLSRGRETQEDVKEPAEKQRPNAEEEPGPDDL